jgi:hypothetical protein
MNQYGIPIPNQPSSVLGWCLLFGGAAILVGALVSWPLIRRERRVRATWTDGHSWRIRVARVALIAGCFVIPVIGSVVAAVGFSMGRVIAATYERGDPAVIAWFVDAASREGMAAFRAVDQDAPVDVRVLQQRVRPSGSLAWDESLQRVLDAPRDRRMMYRELAARVRADLGAHAKDSLSHIGAAFRAVMGVYPSLAALLIVLSNAVAGVVSVVLVRPTRGPGTAV